MVQFSFLPSLRISRFVTLVLAFPIGRLGTSGEKIGSEDKNRHNPVVQFFTLVTNLPVCLMAIEMRNASLFSLVTNLPIRNVSACVPNREIGNEWRKD